ncbi:MAG: UDP-N-acetylmuramate--L-alanine ligase [Patescibacteria group bacterium]|nr:UDP-N-acetylmuramate--L-alanine ligase [Patescibacteria group bacterium]
MAVVKTNNIFAQAEKMHFIGVKGVAVSGLAIIAKQMGKIVAGSDVPESFGTDSALHKNGVKVFPKFDAKNLGWDPDIILVGASWPATHPEAAAAGERKIPIVPESEFRGFLSRQKKTIAVTGVHGKSTTTALLAWVFAQAKLDPSYLVGTPEVLGLPGNGHWGKGEFFIVEGDEYAKSQTERVAKFLDLDPWVSIVTTLEWEHVDVYPDVASMEKTFAKLAVKTKHLVIACADWPAVMSATAKAKRRVTYGVSAHADYQMVDFRPGDSQSTFAVLRQGKPFAKFFSPLIGKHNALNAVAALIAAKEAGIDVKNFAKALQSFQGLARRQQTTVGDGVTWVDDYGHHPTEIARTLEAIRERYPKSKLWVVFQPHLASRTRALMPQFAHSFAPADRVLIVDLFASAREAGDPAASADLAAAIGKFHLAVRACGNLQATADYLSHYLQPGDVVVTMGAGDVYKVRDFIK